MFCGSLCKPTRICLLAFQNVCYHCIHYGLGRSWTPSLPNKLYDSRYLNTDRQPEDLVSSEKHPVNFITLYFTQLFKQHKLTFGSTRMKTDDINPKKHILLAGRDVLRYLLVFVVTEPCMVNHQLKITA